MKKTISDAQAAYKAAVAEENLLDPHFQTSPAPSLSSFNTCSHIEFNSAPRFENALSHLDADADVGTLYVRSHPDDPDD